ncbi:MAG: histidine kinase N-terminal 7TM domain-containing protein, partial [Candidatus Omnitrophota bacterium]
MKFYSLSSLIAGLGCFFFAAVVLLKGRKNNQNRSFFIATILTGIWTLFPFLTSLPERDDIALFIARLLYLFASFVPTAWFYFMINVLGSSKREKIKLFTFYSISIIFAFLSSTRFLVKGVTRFAPYFCPQAGPWYFLFIIFFAGVFIYILCTLFTALRNARGYYRRQLIYVSWAYFIGAMSGVIHFIAAYTNKEPFSHDLLLIVYPFILAYAVVKHRL